LNLIYVHKHEHSVPQVKERRQRSESLEQVRVVAARSRYGGAQFSVAKCADHGQHATQDPHGQTDTDRSSFYHHSRWRDKYTYMHGTHTHKILKKVQ